jgi:hypothetical protein
MGVFYRFFNDSVNAINPTQPDPTRRNLSQPDPTRPNPSQGVDTLNFYTSSPYM